MRYVIIMALMSLVACGGQLVIGADGTIRVVVQDGRIQFDDPILFATNSEEILEESFPLLDKIAETLVQHTEIGAVRIEGHTDATGSASSNQELSERRAQSVVAALQSRGVTQQMSAEGIGQTRPLCEETTDECNARNRRVEIHIVE